MKGMLNVIRNKVLIPTLCRSLLRKKGGKFGQINFLYNQKSNHLHNRNETVYSLVRQFFMVPTSCCKVRLFQTLNSQKDAMYFAFLCSLCAVCKEAADEVSFL